MNIVKAVSVIIGTIIGAGFASGKEIYIFFGQYGKFGIIGAMVSATLTGVIIYSTIAITKRLQIKSNNEFLEKISNSSKVKIILENVINAFLLVSFWIMCAGFCTFFKQEFKIPIIITASINAIITYFLLMKNMDGIIKLNLIVVPIMVVIIIAISIKNYPIINLINNLNTNTQNLGKSILSAILYTSYNSITLIPIIVLLTTNIKNKRENKIITLVSVVIFFVLIIAIYQMLTLSAVNISKIEIPVLTILDECHPVEKMVYSIAIITAILTSAISSGYGVVENIKDRRKYKTITFAMCLTEIPIAYIGFGKLVEILYPLFGVIGIIQIITILKKANSIAKNAKNWYKLYRKNEGRNSKNET